MLLMTLFSILFGFFIWRYKIYIEGSTWSVSEKYILACNSMTLLVMPQYHDFFTRSLVPMQHYLPINITNNICRDLKLAVEWGNNHPDKVNLSFSPLIIGTTKFSLWTWMWWLCFPKTVLFSWIMKNKNQCRTHIEMHCLKAFSKWC